MLLANARTTTGSDGWMKQDLADTAISAQGNTSSGVGSVTVVIEASEDGVVALLSPIGIITLTLGTTPVADGFVMKARWNYIRARVSAISGTGATVSAETSLKDR
jgi:hypothetical protein